MKNLGLGLGLALGLLCLAPVSAQQSPEFTGILQRLKSAPLQPQSLRKALLPADIKEINQTIASYARKREESRRRRTSLSDRETKAFLVGLAVKGYELYQRGDSKKSSSKEDFSKKLREQVENKALTDELRNLAVQLSSGRTSTGKMYASKSGDAAKEGVEAVEGAVNTATEATAKVGQAVTNKGEQTASAVAKAVEVVVAWLTS